MNLSPHNQEEFEQRVRASLAFTAGEPQAGTINAGLGLTYEGCDLAARSLTVSMAIQPWMYNPSATTIHGGLSAAFADHALGTLIYCMNDCQFTPTVSLSLTYLKPVRTDRRLLIEARLQSCGHRLATATARAWSQGEADPAYVATGTFYIVHSS